MNRIEYLKRLNHIEFTLLQRDAITDNAVQNGINEKAIC